MECQENLVYCLTWLFLVGGPAYFLQQLRRHTPYGRYTPLKGPTCPAQLAWFLQELPSVLVPLGLLLGTKTQPGLGRNLLLGTFFLHYCHRTFIYALWTRGRPTPVSIVFYGATFCTLNGFLQAHFLLHCSHYQSFWLTDARLATGLLLFFLGMCINIHSDHILRNLRRPGEVVYRIPKGKPMHILPYCETGGMFELVSGANFTGEILEWCGYAVATWSLPTLAFTLFTICSIGPRAYHHHRDYLLRFEDYPRSRKAVIPFIL